MSALPPPPLHSRHARTATRRWLQTHRWMRLHIAVIALLCLAALWGTAAALRLLGVGSLGLRYALSLAVGYGVYLLLLRLWAAYLLGRSTGDAADAVDVVDLGLDVGLDVGSAAAESLDGAGTLVEAAAGADEAAVVLVPLAVAVTVAIALAALLGFGVTALFGVEVLLGVTVEVAIASAAAGLAWRHQADIGRQGWLACALSYTWRGAAVLWLAGVLVGSAIDHWLPEADSLPQAVRLIWVR
jgi:hypothetical protein